MNVRLGIGILLAGIVSATAVAQQPAGVTDMFANISSQPGTHTSFTFDRDMLQAMSGAMGGDNTPVAGLNSITFDNYRFHDAAFYVPEETHAIIAAYRQAGWKHLVDANLTPKESAQPTKPITDLWLHFAGADIDGVTVLIRGVKQMNVIEVTGILKPLDLVHLSGHFGIPKVDQHAVMVPAPDGK